MVRGLEKFKEYFGEYAGRYVLIGGTACDILLENMGAERFLTRAKNETIDLKGIGIRNVTMLELIERIQNSYELA